MPSHCDLYTFWNSFPALSLDEEFYFISTCVCTTRWVLATGEGSRGLWYQHLEWVRSGCQQLDCVSLDSRESVCLGAKEWKTDEAAGAVCVGVNDCVSVLNGQLCLRVVHTLLCMHVPDGNVCMCLMGMWTVSLASCWTWDMELQQPIFPWTQVWTENLA